MSEHTMSEIPTPMDAIKQIYELFQTRRNFTTGCLARNRWDIQVATNRASACRWCLSGAVFHVYSLSAATIYQSSAALPRNVRDTFKLLWEKFPANLKMSVSDSWEYVSGIAQFNDEFGYTGVMRLLQAVIDDTEYKWEA